MRFWPVLLCILIATSTTQPSDPLSCNVTTTSSCTANTVINATCGNFSSPNYPSADYPINTGCIWKLIVPRDHRIVISFDTFKLEDCSNCKCDHVEVRNGLNEDGTLIAIYCGQSKPQPILTNSNNAWIKFKSDSAFTGKGFTVRFKAYQRPLQKLTTCPPSNRYNPVCPWLGDDAGMTVCCYAEGPRCCYPGGTNCTDNGAILRSYCPRSYEAKDLQLCCDFKGHASCCKPYKEEFLFSGTHIFALSVAAVLLLFTSMVIVFCCCCKNCSKPMGI